MSERGNGLVELGTMLRARGYAFTTVTPATHARVLARPHHEAITLRDIFGWNRPFAEADLDAELLRCMRDAQVLAGAGDQLRCTVRLSTAAGQQYFHSGFPTAEQDAVFFGPDTYRFVRALEQSSRGIGATIRRVVDIGCGSGAAAIVLAQRFPAAEIFASDINQRALDYAAINCRLAGTSNVRVRYSDLLDQLEGEFDLVVANPPYLLDPGERTYRHGGGELGGGLSLRIVQAAIQRLAPGGWLWLYTGAPIVGGASPFLRDAAALLGEAGMTWACEEIDVDVFGEELDEPAYAATERIAALWLCARKGER